MRFKEFIVEVNPITNFLSKFGHQNSLRKIGREEVNKNLLAQCEDLVKQFEHDDPTLNVSNKKELRIRFPRWVQKESGGSIKASDVETEIKKVGMGDKFNSILAAKALFGAYQNNKAANAAKLSSSSQDAPLESSETYLKNITDNLQKFDIDGLHVIAEKLFKFPTAGQDKNTDISRIVSKMKTLSVEQLEAANNQLVYIINKASRSAGKTVQASQGSQKTALPTPNTIDGQSTSVGDKFDDIKNMLIRIGRTKEQATANATQAYKELGANASEHDITKRALQLGQAVNVKSTPAEPNDQQPKAEPKVNFAPRPIDFKNHRLKK